MRVKWNQSGSVCEDWRIAFCDFSVDGFNGVSLNPMLFFFWNIGVCKDCVDRAFWNASTAVNALIRIDDEVGICFSKRLHWANDDAFLVFVIDAG